MRCLEQKLGLKRSGTRRFEDPRILIRIRLWEGRILWRRGPTSVAIVRNRKTRPSLPARTSFFLLLVSKSIIVLADIHGAVGAPFPAAVISVEMAMMVVMTMSKMAMTRMAVAYPVVAVAAMPAMPAMTMTSSESLARDGQRSGGQRQSSDRSRNDCLELRHGRLLLGRARIALR